MKNIELLDTEHDTHELVVVAFDLCSSSKLIEDLTRTKTLVAYDRMLTSIHQWLCSNAMQSNYVAYKFTGDGWILLFPVSKMDGPSLMRFLVALSKQHSALHKKFVDSHLESIPSSIGLTFGVEMGTLRKVRFGNEIEFVGRALNVACRLQAAVQNKGPELDYRCLFSRKVFNTYLEKLKEFQFFDVERTLRNISGGERYRCVKTDLTQYVKSA